MRGLMVAVAKKIQFLTNLLTLYMIFHELRLNYVEISKAKPTVR